VAKFRNWQLASCLIYARALLEYVIFILLLIVSTFECVLLARCVIFREIRGR